MEKVLVDVWGYSMTIVDFYKVVRETEKSVWVVPIGSKENHTGFLSGNSVADTSKVLFDKPSILRKRPQKDGQMWYKGSLHMAENFQLKNHLLEVWDGSPKSFNHAD